MTLFIQDGEDGDEGEEDDDDTSGFLEDVEDDFQDMDDAAFFRYDSWLIALFIHWRREFKTVKNIR